MPDFTIPGPQIQNPLALLAQYGQIRAQQQQLAEAPLRMQQLQQGVQEGQLGIQQKQQTLTDQQAKTAAMTEWDGNDYNKLYPLIIKHGGSADAVMSLKSQVQEQQQKAATTFKDMADGGKAQVETIKMKGDQINGALAPLLDPTQVPDAQLPQALTSTVQDLTQKGLLDPQHAQAAQQVLQSGNPAQIRQQIGLFGKGLLAQSQIAEQAQKDATTKKDTAEAAKAQADVDYYKNNGGAPGVPLATQATNIYAKPAAQRTPAENLFIKGYEKNNDVTRIQPAQVRIQGLMAMPQAVVDPNDPSRTIFATKKDAIGQEAPSSGEAAGARKVLTSAIGGKLGDTINSYNTATAHLDQLDKAADALKNGDIQALNKVGNAFSAATGNPAPTNFQAVKSAVAGEVSKTFKGGQATDAEIKEFEGAISSANSPAQLKGVIQTYKGLMASKREAIQQQVQQGTQGKPNFNPSTPSVIYARDPQGNLHQAPTGTALPAGWKAQ